MPNIFKANIAGAINSALGPLVFDMTLIKPLPGSRTSALTSGTHPTTTSYAAKGFIDEYNVNEVDGTIVRMTDRKGILLGASLAAGIVPAIGDTVVAEALTQLVISVKRDPAGATYEVQLR